MLINIDDEKTTHGWSVWRSGPHVPLYLMEVHDTKQSALASATSLLHKNWGDYFVVRRVDFGPPTILEAETKKAPRPR